MCYIFFVLLTFLLVSCSNSVSFSESYYKDSNLEFETDKDHKGFVFVKASGLSVQLGTNDKRVVPEEQPMMKVVFDYDFSISDHEITQNEYASLMGGDPCEDCSGLPIANMTYGDAILYANAKSKSEGFDTVYSYDGVIFDAVHHVLDFENFIFNPKVAGYRLPTEAEWVLAASYDWDPENSWNSDNSDNKAHDVCSKGKNSVGLCDMAGNLAEWVNDKLGYFKDTTVTDFVGAPGVSSGERVVKGGSFRNGASKMSLSSRGDFYTVITSTMAEHVGARLAFGVIPNPVWMTGSGIVGSSSFKSLSSPTLLKFKIGTSRAKIAFVNGRTKNLVFLNYGAGSSTFIEISDTLRVYHPDISPDGEWVAFCTEEEGGMPKSELYVRRLNAIGSDLVKLDVESAAIPRFRVTPEGDTVIVYVSSPADNSDDASFESSSTWQVTFSNGKFGKPQKLFKGAYHGGVSPDNRMAVSGARLLRARKASKKGSVLDASARDTIWYDGEQACNASLSRDGSNRTLFLDFHGKPGMDFVGEKYIIHERMLVADSNGKLIQSIASPKGYTFDYTEWVDSTNLVIASLKDEVNGTSGMHPKVVLIDLNDSSMIDLANGDDLMFPCLWRKVLTLSAEESFLDLDSVGVYMTSYSDITTRIMKVKMDYFWQYRESAEAVVIGSSRSFSGVDPTMISSLFTINMAYSAEDMTATDFFARNYILPLMPKLKILAVTLDYDRWYVEGEHWKSWFGDVPGYVYDENHSFWKDGVPKSMADASLNALSPDDGEYYTYAYRNGLYISTTEGWVSDNPEVSWQKNWFETNHEAYLYNKNILEGILKAAKEKGVLVVGMVFPQSPYYMKKGVWGRYGLLPEHAKTIKKEMNELTKKYKNFYIFDEYNDGKNDYVYEEFSNEDHLNLDGAVKFAKRLNSLFMSILNEE